MEILANMGKDRAECLPLYKYSLYFYHRHISMFSIPLLAFSSTIEGIGCPCHRRRQPDPLITPTTLWASVNTQNFWSIALAGKPPVALEEPRKWVLRKSLARLSDKVRSLLV